MLSGKIAVVIGGHGGIGGAIAERFALEGATVYATSRRAEEGEIELGAGRLRARRIDAADLAALAVFFETVKREAGRVDVLAINAGISEFATLDAISEDHFDRTFALNVRALLFAAKAATAVMPDGGSIVLVGSIADAIGTKGYGVYWQLLDTPIILGGGYVNARIERTSDGDFFAGIVDKIAVDGRLTDVILAFAGAQGRDAVQGESILAGIPLDEAARATQVYERRLNAPRYAKARIHVTGHSLGTGYAQYVPAYALKTHGVAATDARSDFLAFEAPNWLASAAAHFAVDPEVAAARMVDFTAANDPVLLTGVARIGINNALPAFNGLPGIGGAIDVIGAHWPTTYAAALGLPDWLTAADQKAAISALRAQFRTGDSISLSYGPAGGMPLTVDGSGKAEWITELAGADRLIGHGGADVLTGGAGADRFSLSTMGTTRLEDLAQAFAGPKVFQIYVFKDRGLTAEFVARCRDAGFHGLALTVDTLVAGSRERDRRSGLSLPPKLTLKSLLSFARHPSWSLSGARVRRGRAGGILGNHTVVVA